MLYCQDLNQLYKEGDSVKVLVIKLDLEVSGETNFNEIMR
jgi:hypothetical protein